MSKYVVILNIFMPNIIKIYSSIIRNYSYIYTETKSTDLKSTLAVARMVEERGKNLPMSLPACLIIKLAI